MTPCLLTDWTRSHPFGYGRRRIGGRGWVAHRWAWTQAYGPIPAGMCVLHRCDNPPCIALDHLFLGTRSVNSHDRHAKGRTRGPHRGSATPSARLTEADIPVIRARLAAGEYQRVIGESYGVSRTTIRKIAHGDRRKPAALELRPGLSAINGDEQTELGPEE